MDARGTDRKHAADASDSTPFAAPRAAEPRLAIEQTKNYGLFVANTLGRDVNTQHAKRIAESMHKSGFWPSRPLTVYPKGGSLVVVDGHHRLIAAQVAGVPVAYVVTSPDIEDEMIAMNQLSRNWVSADYIAHARKQGNEHYKTLSEYIDKGLLQRVAVLLLAPTLALGRSGVQEGGFVVQTTAKADKLVAFLARMRPTFPTLGLCSYQTALALALLTPKFSIDQLRARVEANPAMLTKASTTDQALDALERVYNMRSTTRFALRHEVKKSIEARRRKADEAAEKAKG